MRATLRRPAVSDANTNSMTTKLTTAESAERGRLERTIKSTKGAFVSCGKALETMRDKKLYRSTHATFEEYCEKVWGWSRPHAYRIIEASQVVLTLPGKMSPIGDKMTEGSARALAKVPKKSRAKVLKEVELTGNLTAKRITEVADQSKNGVREAKPEVVHDDTGYVVPERAMAFWNRKSEAKGILKLISDARCAIKDLDKDDPMWSEVNFNAVLSELNTAYNAFAVAVPHAVCTACQGVQAKTCTLCKGRGVISKFRFDHAVPEELKKIRAKACA